LNLRSSGRGASRTSLAFGVTVLVVVAGLVIYTLAGPGGQPTTTAASSSTSGAPSLGIALSPAVPLIAPGQTQNYTLLQIQLSGAPNNTTVTLSAYPPSGISFLLNRTTASLGAAQSIPVVLKAAAGLQPGNYHVFLGVSARSGALVNKSLTIDVVPALVLMKNLAFHPQNITVAKGTSVSWINLDSTIGCCDPGNHNVVFLSGGTASSPVMKRLDTWSFTFDAPATVQYFCSIHPSMKGTVTITG